MSSNESSPFTSPERHRLPKTRNSLTHKFKVSNYEGYVTVGMYDDGRLGEMFLTDVGKEGSLLAGIMGAWSVTFSVALQYGTPLETLIKKYAHIRFEPGPTGDSRYPEAASVVDYIAFWLAAQFAQELVKDLWPSADLRPQLEVES